jgi:hypothetical protein
MARTTAFSLGNGSAYATAPQMITAKTSRLFKAGL